MEYLFVCSTIDSNMKNHLHCYRYQRLKYKFNYTSLVKFSYFIRWGNDNNEASQACGAVQRACCIYSSLQRQRALFVVLEGLECPIIPSGRDIVIVINA